MISIRAGLVNDILNGRIQGRYLSEIIYYSGLKDTVENFNIMRLITPILKEDRDDLNTENDSEIYFTQSQDYIENYLINEVVKYNGRIYKDIDFMNESLYKLFASEHMVIPYYESEIKPSPSIRNILAEYCPSSVYLNKDVDIFKTTFQEYREFNKRRSSSINKIKNAIQKVAIKDEKIHPNYDKIDRNKIIDMEWKPYNLTKYGVRAENKVIKRLEKQGWKIESCEGKYGYFEHIVLSGKPDGYIVDCPVDEFKGAYLEIKTKKNNYIPSSYINQIVSYYKITGSPIVLVTLVGNNMNIVYYSVNELKAYWKLIERKLYYGCCRLYNLINIKTVEDYDKLQKLYTKKIITF